MSERISEENVGQSIAPAPAQVQVPQPATPAPAVVSVGKVQKPKAKAPSVKQGGEDISSLMAELRKELAEVRELKESLKQKDAEAQKVDPQTFAVAGTSPNDLQRHKSKAERMKDWLWSHPMKPIFIPLEPGEKKGFAVQPVTKNGYRLNVPKGVWIEVPGPIAEKVMQRLEQTDAALDNKFRLDKATPDKLEALTG